MTEEAPRYFTTEEVAVMFKRSPYTVREWIKSQKLIANRVGRQYFVSAEAIRQFVEEKR